MIQQIRKLTISLLGVALSIFTVYEVSYSLLTPLSQLAVFAMLGIGLCFVMYPLHPRLKDNTVLQVVDLVLVAAFGVCCIYLLSQGTDLANRAGAFTRIDIIMAIIGTVLILEATRRSIGLALPIIAIVFLIYAFFGSSLPDWLFPHRGYSIDRVAAKCFLGTEGIFGTAMRVMFTYVFLFVIFGAFLELSGATQFIIDFAQRVFGRSAGGPAKVSVLGSGLMGSLSGSAVANAVTTGTFTIPMMRSAGFQPHIAGGITAAAASGGALVPPIMGAGAYMMLEIVTPQVTFLEIVKAALLPALLYYLSILLIVHFYARRIGTAVVKPAGQEKRSLMQFEGLIFFGALGALIAFLLMGKTPFRAVTYSLEVILILSLLGPKLQLKTVDRIMSLVLFATITVGMALYRSSIDPDLRLGEWSTWADAAIPAMLGVLLFGLIHPGLRPQIHEVFTKSARGGVSLVSASACVGIVIGVVSLTGVGTAFPNAIVPLAEHSLLLALIAIMLCSIVLGMGLPSAVCYLLMATLIGPVLNRLGVIPLAAHLFIFYFGMMSMVTPPVALAAYASASIAKTKIMPTAMAAFRFSLVGFTLPYMFIYRPELLLMNSEGQALAWSDTPSVLLAITAAIVGITSLALGITGYFRAPLPIAQRVLMFIAAALLLLPEIRLGGQDIGLWVNLAGGALFVALVVMNWNSTKTETPQLQPDG